MRTWLKETFKAEGLMEKGRPGFPVNVKCDVVCGLIFIDLI